MGNRHPLKQRTSVVCLSLALAASSGCAVSAPAGRPSPSNPVSPPPQAVPSPVVTVVAPEPAGPVSLAGANAKAIVTASGVVAPVMGSAPEGLVVGTPCGRSAVVSQGTILDQATVVLDPGHGGIETGSVGANGTTEKDLNLAVSRFTAESLQARGYSVVLTRSSDYRITLQARAAIARALNPKAFVSIHHNGDPDGPHEGPGTETFYQLKGTAAAASKRLAGLIYEEVVRTLSAFHDVSWTADRDAGAKYRPGSEGNDYYGILRHSQGIAAVISEAAFLSNPSEAELLSRVGVQRAEGDAIARAIIRFLTSEDPGSGYVEPYPRTQPAGSGGGSSDCVDPQL